MQTLAGKHVLLGVTGGIAAYKSAELVRLLRGAGAEVRVVMTRAAAEFITPMTLQALSGQPVRQALFDPAHEAAMGHIELARWAELVLVAPASADFLARLAAGMADDLLATLCLATTAPILVAPAMNHRMWLAAATRDNVATLERRGIRLAGPAEGEQACGERGPGRMLEPAALAAAAADIFGGAALAGVEVLVTAGPTFEAIDPVRFIGNRSSGRMGYAVAAAAAEAGARVTLISGPTALPAPPGVTRVSVESAGEMQAAVEARRCDLFIAAAAVADYRPEAPAPGKIKKGAEQMTLALTRTPDILAGVAARPDAPFTVGFAAETDDLEHHAREKLGRKGLDMVAANWVGEAAGGGGFDSEWNALQLFWNGGGESLPAAEKGALARRLIAVVAARYRRSDKMKTGENE